MDDIRNIVNIVQHSPHAWIAHQYKNSNIKNSIAEMDEDLLVRDPKAGGTNNPSYGKSPSDDNFSTNLKILILVCIIP